MRSVLIALLAFAVAVHAQAQTSGAGPSINYTATGGTVSAGTLQTLESGATRQIAGAVASPGEQLAAGLDADFAALLQRPFTPGDVIVTDKVAADLGAGAAAEMAVARQIAWKGVARGAARALPYVGQAYLAYQLFTAARCYFNPHDPNNVDCDSGQSSTAGHCFTWYYGRGDGTHSQGCDSSASAAAADIAKQFDAENTSSDANGTSTQTTSVGSCTSNTSSWLCAATYRRVYDVKNCDAAGGATCHFDSGANSYSFNGNVQASQVCPAFTDALNPANSGAEGASPGPDGKCPTGRYNSMAPDDAADQVAAAAGDSWKAKAAQLVAEALGQHVNFAPQPNAAPSPLAVSPGDAASPAPVPLAGPQTVVGPQTTTTTTPPGGSPTTTTNSTQYNITYNNNTYNYTTSTTTASPGGTTTTTGAPPDIKTCGLPGTPACKIDESGTPTYVPPTDPFTPQVAKDASDTASTTASVVGPDWGFIGAPPLASCEAIEFPTEPVTGRSLGSTNKPCEVVDDVRGAMAYIWAIMAAWMCFGFIRQTVNGG